MQNLIWKEDLKLEQVRISDTFVFKKCGDDISLNWLFYSNKQRQILKKVNGADILGVKRFFENLTEFRKNQVDQKPPAVVQALEKSISSTRNIENLRHFY